MRLPSAVLALTLALALPRAGEAQRRLPPLSLQARVGPTWPVGGPDDLGPGTEWGVAASAAFPRGLEVYAGFSRVVLRGEDGVEDRADSGLDVGAGWRAVGTRRVTPWVRIGLAFHEAETQRDRDGADDGKTVAGVATAVGLETRLAGPLTVTAGAAWTDYRFGTDDLHVNLLRLELGARLRLR